MIKLALTRQSFQLSTEGEGLQPQLGRVSKRHGQRGSTRPAGRLSRLGETYPNLVKNKEQARPRPTGLLPLYPFSPRAHTWGASIIQSYNPSLVPAPKGKGLAGASRTALFSGFGSSRAAPDPTRERAMVAKPVSKACNQGPEVSHTPTPRHVTTAARAPLLSPR